LYCIEPRLKRSIEMSVTHRTTAPRLLDLLLALALLLAPLFGLTPTASAQESTPGTVVAWGWDDSGVVSNRPTGADYTAIAAGHAHSLALKSDGTVVAWGWDSHGQVSGTPTEGGYIAIAAGVYHSLALKSDGTVVAWGWDSHGQVSGTPTDGGYTAIAASGSHGLALRSDGTVVAWGWDGEGEVSGRPTDRGYTAIAASESYSLALRSDGTVVVWGWDYYGLVSNRPTDRGYIAIAAGPYHSLALRSDGTVVAWGLDVFGSVAGTPTDRGYIAIAAGGYHSLALFAPDTTPPVIASTVSGTQGNSEWYTSDVQLSWNVSDGGSAITSTSGCNPSSVTSDTASLLVTCSATSAGGTATQSVTIKRDATVPTISAAATTSPNAGGWYSGDVSVAFSCADAVSGVASCPASQTLTGEGSAISSSAQTVSDRAGNTSAPSNVVTVQIDRTAPAVSVTGVTNGATYPLSSAPTAGCATTDALSGVATQATLSTSGSGAGSYTATCSGASDNAGNTGAASVSYTVAYPWSGFFQPIDNAPTVNTVKAGQAIPAKFSLGGHYGLNIFAAGYPKVQVVSCSTSAPTDEIEQTVTAGSSSLSYDAASGQYTYTWKTDKSWAGSCRQLVMRLADGTDHTALFRFR
jgi:hypothetical protein